MGETKHPRPNNPVLGAIGGLLGIILGALMNAWPPYVVGWLAAVVLLAVLLILYIWFYWGHRLPREHLERARLMYPFALLVASFTATLFVHSYFSMAGTRRDHMDPRIRDSLAVMIGQGDQLGRFINEAPTDSDAGAAVEAWVVRGVPIARKVGSVEAVEWEQAADGPAGYATTPGFDDTPALRQAVKQRMELLREWSKTP